MPGCAGCPICPFASDPEVVCAAVEKGHAPFCRSVDPKMPAAVRKLTLQLRGEWVEPEPAPPVDRPDPPLPSLPRMALNYAKAEARDVAAGRPRLDAAAVAARLAVCRGDAEAGIPACERYVAATDQCGVCGCYLGGAKAVRSVESCPLGKWPA